MSVILDTHILLWSLVDHPRLNDEIRSVLDSNELYVSSLSCFEIQHKRVINKLHGDVEVNELFESGLFKELPFNAQHAEYTINLPLIHRDPFDRMLIAQSIVEGIPLVTSDRYIQQYDFEFIGV